MIYRNLLILSTLLLTPGIFAETSTSMPDSKSSEIVGYNKGFYIQTPDEKYKLTIGGYIQGQFSYQAVENADNLDTFRIRRARLKFSGNVLCKDLNYELEYDFATPKLLSTFIQYHFNPEIKGRIGQYQVPFDFEALVSASEFQLVDRSIAFTFFGVPDEREFGAGIMGNILDKKVEYNLGIFNGEGLNNVNQNEQFRFAGRLVYNLIGEHGYTFADTAHSENPAVAIGVAGMYNDTPGYGATVGLPDSQIISFTPDVAFKYMGASVHGAFFYQNTSPSAGADFLDTGWLVQAGYFVIPKHLELAARVAMVTPELANDQAEYTGGINYFFDGHKVKTQLDYSALTVDNGVAAGNDRFDHRVRLQMQIKL